MAKKKSVKLAAESRKRGRSESTESNQTSSDSGREHKTGSPVTSTSPSASGAGNKKKRKIKEPRMYQCPHCPNEPPYAGASGLWYHMKRHHGAVTRPYNKSKSGTGGKVSKPRTPKKKKDKASKKVKKNHHDDPPLTPGGRSKFPVSPRFKHVHQRRDTEEEDSEDDYDSDDSTGNGGFGRGGRHPRRSGPLYMDRGGTTVMSSNGLVRPSLVSLNSSTMQLDDLRSVVALKSLNASPAVSSLRKQPRDGLSGTPSSSSSSSSLAHDASSSEMMLLSEVALLLGASKNMNHHSNNPTTVVLKTTTTTATTTTTEVSVDNDDRHGKKTDSTAAHARVVAAVAVDVNATLHQHSIGGATALTRNSSNASTVDGSAVGKTPKKGGLGGKASSSSSLAHPGGLSPATQKSPMPLSLDKNKTISRALDMEDSPEDGGQGKDGRTANNTAFPNLVL